MRSPARGIQDVEPIDLTLGGRAGLSLKLLGVAEATGEGISLLNAPVFVGAEHRLARTGPTEMGVWIESDAPEAMFVGGSGAGRFPTGSAVVADILEIARRRSSGGSAQYHETPPACAQGTSAGQPARRRFLRCAEEHAQALERHLHDRGITIEQHLSVGASSAIVTGACEDGVIDAGLCESVYPILG